MPLPHDIPLAGTSGERGAFEVRFDTKSRAPETGFSERGRFCVMIFAGSGNYNDCMRQLSTRLKRCPLPIESIDAKHGLVEVVVNGSLYDLNDVFFRIGREFEEIIHP